MQPASDPAGCCIDLCNVGIDAFGLSLSRTEVLSCQQARSGSLPARLGVESQARRGVGRQTMGCGPLLEQRAL